MDSEVAKADVKRFFDSVNTKDKEAMTKWIDESVAEDFVNHSSFPNLSNDREGFKEGFWQLFKMFPDVTITINEMAFENDILCFRYIMQGIGSSDSIGGLAMIKYRNERIVDRWASLDSKQ